MVKIRLSRVGKKGESHYRVIAIRAREKLNGKAIEFLGFYNPRTNPSTFEIKKDRIKYWLSVGAQPTYTIARLLEKEGLYKGKKKKFSNKPGRKKQEKLKEAEAKAGVKPEAKAEVKEMAKPETVPSKEEKKETKPEVAEVKPEVKK